jgi:hypothetical protein
MKPCIICHIRYRTVCLLHMLVTVVAAMRSTRVMIHLMYTNAHNGPCSRLKTQILQSRCVGLSVKVGEKNIILGLAHICYIAQATAKAVARITCMNTQCEGPTSSNK